MTAECFLVKTSRYPLFTTLTRKIFAYGVIRRFFSVKAHDPLSDICSTIGRLSIVDGEGLISFVHAKIS